MKTTAPQAPRRIEVELLALDLTTCTRCVGSRANIETAFALVRPVLEATGAHLTLRTHVVATIDEARRWQLVASPTIRVNGRDIASELLESPCATCTELCGCGAETQCRIWRYQGAEFTEAPVGLIVEAVLRAVLVEESPTTTTDAPVPTNLQRFFAGRASPAEACCTGAEQATCCAVQQKEECCHDSEPTTCGCR